MTNSRVIFPASFARPVGGRYRLPRHMRSHRFWPPNRTDTSHAKYVFEVLTPSSHGAAMMPNLAAHRIVRSAHEVVQTYPEIVGKGDCNVKARHDLTIFNFLIMPFCNIKCICNSLLGAIVRFSQCFQAFAKNYQQLLDTPKKAC